jgi:hypothetical protein
MPLGLIALFFTGALFSGQSPDGTALVRGRVIDAVSGRALRGASVHLIPPYDSNHYRPPQRSTTTDANGTFEIGAVVTGEYSLSATSTGDYLEASYGRRGPGGNGGTVRIADNARLDVTLRAWPAASIGGRVLDDQGRSVAEAHLTLVNRDGNTSGRTVSDDRGEYRFSGLIPGDYSVGIPIALASRTTRYAPQPRSPGAYVPPFQPYLLDRGGRTILTTYGAPLPPPSREGQANTYITTFLGGGSFADRKYVSLATGQSRGGVDVVLRDRPARRVSGVATTLTGPAPGLVLRLESEESAPWFRADQITATASADGAFVFVAVPDGSYRLTAYKRNPPFTEVTFAGAAPSIAQDDYTMGDKDVLFASMPMTVAGDQDGIEVLLRPGTPIAGRIVLDDGTTPAFGNQAPRIMLFSDRSDPFAGTAPYVQVASDGTFTGRARPGAYVLSAAWPSPGWSFRAARMDGRDVSGRTIQVGESPLALELTFAPGETGIQGQISDARGNPTRDATVLVFPIEENTWEVSSVSDFIKSEQPRKPTFSITNLAAGDYYVVALDEGAQRAGRTTPALQRLVPLATRVRVDPGQPAVVNLVMREVPPR